jgi:hypothetical protein
LNNLGCLFELTVLGALAIDTVACDRQGAVKIVDLVTVQANRFLAAPAEPFRPRRMPEHHTLYARLIFYHDLDSLIFTRRIENL